MDDNATCHRTLRCSGLSRQRGQVAGRNYPPTNKNTLIRALIEEWDTLPQQLLDNVVQSMVLEITSRCRPAGLSVALREIPDMSRIFWQLHRYSKRMSSSTEGTRHLIVRQKEPVNSLKNQSQGIPNVFRHATAHRTYYESSSSYTNNLSAVPRWNRALSTTSGNGSQMTTSGKIGVHEIFRSFTARLFEGIFQNIMNSMQHRCQTHQATSGRNFEHLL
ncbi:hypothetical protein TNCV_4131161 [Trichonephila clavipes]|nr:hypothetical protein TNCV_4131161 [Trichonephila clavipes]